MTVTVLVTGGTGRLGRALVPRLVDAGHRVRVLTRREREPADWAWAIGDLSNGSGVAEAVAGVEVIIHLATTNARGDVIATRNLIDAANGIGRPHLLYVSIVGVESVALGYYRAKRACERLAEESGLPWTILRTTQFHDLIAMICDAQRWLPVTVMPSKVRVQPIDVTEVAERLVAIATLPSGGWLPDLGGPEVRDAGDLARTYLRTIGRRRLVWSIPLPGRAMRGYRLGNHLVPDRAVGRIRFDEFVARIARERSGRC